MSPDTTLQLGAFAFAGNEIPEKIAFGGSQRNAVHELIGGIKVVDAMGRADSDLTWSGIFVGSSAVDRARYLDTQRVLGAALALTWGEFSYSVLIADFRAEYERFYQIPYTITCLVIADLANPTTSITPPSLDAVTPVDMASATSLGTSIGDSSLNSLLVTLGTAIAAVPSFANVTPNVISTVVAPLGQVQARIVVLIVICVEILSGVSTFGGVIEGVAPSVSAADLTEQTSNAQTLVSLYQLQSVTDRMQANFSGLNTAPRTITVAGGNLYRIAQEQYGDAMAWTTIATANGMTDPFIVGTATLFLPSSTVTTDGVLNA